MKKVVSWIIFFSFQLRLKTVSTFTRHHFSISNTFLVCMISSCLSMLRSSVLVLACDVRCMNVWCSMHKHAECWWLYKVILSLINLVPEEAIDPKKTKANGLASLPWLIKDLAPRHVLIRQEEINHSPTNTRTILYSPSSPSPVDIVNMGMIAGNAR